jgi:hypothetical protein
MPNTKATRQSRSEDDKDTQFVPVFITAQVPLKVLNDFLENSIAGERPRETEMAPVLIDTKDVKSLTTGTEPPLQEEFKSPFQDWTAEQVYEFFLSEIQPLGGELSGEWPAHCFIILDERTAEDGKTCFLCSDVPDYFEEDKVILKTVRAKFRPILEEIMLYETFLWTPSEAGNGALWREDGVFESSEQGPHLRISVMPPLLNSAARRQAISYGLFNENVPGAKERSEEYKRKVKERAEAEERKASLRSADEDSSMS